MKGDLKGIKFTLYCLKRAIRHPRSLILYHYCPDCRIRFPASSDECPQCHEKVGNSPDLKQDSPIPWWGSVLCIVIGIVTWVTAACLKVPGLDEAARVLVYVPLGSLFNMSLQK
ncbi:hypothetical protein ES703_94064 [subsurface metagenome]